MHIYCKACDKLLDSKKRRYRFRATSEKKIRELIASSGKEILEGDWICRVCSNNSLKFHKKNIHDDVADQQQNDLAAFSTSTTTTLNSLPLQSN